MGEGECCKAEKELGILKHVCCYEDPNLIRPITPPVESVAAAAVVVAVAP